MIKSMTGFGRGDDSAEKFHVTAEIKTLNSRYLDISIRLPQSLQHKELQLKEMIQKHLKRGKVNVSVNVDKSAGGVPEVTYNAAIVESYSRILEDIRRISGINETLKLGDLLHFPDIFTEREDDPETVEMIWKCTCKAAETALIAVNKMRIQEGEELKNDLKGLLNDISVQLEQIGEAAQKNAGDVKDRLKQRISEMVDEDKIDSDRLELEIALIIDKMDINEELVRLRSHIKFFEEALENKDNVGRRLNFLCQEINRELNTIGSKSSDYGIAHCVVIGKEKLEQIREQVQNIE